MPKIKFIQEAGFLYDLLCLFILYFNRPLWDKLMTIPNRAEEDFEFYESILKDCADIPDDLYLFFYLKNEKNAFMTEKYLKNRNSFEFDYFSDLIGDNDAFIENMLNYYFEEKGASLKATDGNFLSAVSILVHESDYSDDIKFRLLSFFINPEQYIRLLIYELSNKRNLLTRYCEKNYHVLLEIQQQFDYALFLKNKKKTEADFSFSLDESNPLSISFCMINKYALLSNTAKNVGIIGVCYQEYFDAVINQKQQFELESFGKAVADKNRIFILSLLKQYGEMTTTEIANKMEVSVNAALYHLSQMNKNMLFTRYEGRTVFYRINKDYFMLASQIIEKYSEKHFQ